jgi:hypothetical protein
MAIHGPAFPDGRLRSPDVMPCSVVRLLIVNNAARSSQMSKFSLARHVRAHAVAKKRGGDVVLRDYLGQTVAVIVQGDDEPVSFCSYKLANNGRRLACFVMHVLRGADRTQRRNAIAAARTLRLGETRPFLP